METEPAFFAKGFIALYTEPDSPCLSQGVKLVSFIKSVAHSER